MFDLRKINNKQTKTNRQKQANNKNIALPLGVCKLSSYTLIIHAHPVTI